MAFKKRKSRGRRYGKRIAHGARRAAMSTTRMMGFQKDGFHGSNALITLGALYGLVNPVFSGYSAADYLTGRVTGLSMSQRLSGAGKAYCVSMLGVGGDPGATVTNAGRAGMAVGAGIGLKIVGKFVNPMIRGSPVKL